MHSKYINNNAHLEFALSEVSPDYVKLHTLHDNNDSRRKTFNISHFIMGHLQKDIKTKMIYKINVHLSKFGLREVLH